MAGGRPTKRQSLVHNEHRQKIETSKLVNALTKHVVEGKKLEPSQVTAALGLLKKTLPDLGAVSMDVEHSGSLDLGTFLASYDRKTREDRS